MIQYADTKTITVYRGQLLPSVELNHIKNNIGKLISINTFCSTTRSLDVAYVYSGAADGYPHGDLESVVFQIDIDVTMTTKPFAYIKDFSSIKDEDEILLSVGTVFRIMDVICYTTVYLLVLSVTHEEDEELKKLIDHYRQESNNERATLQEHHETTQVTNNENTLELFGKLLERTGDFERAEKYYRIRLGELSNNHDDICFIYISLARTYLQRAQYTDALENVDIAVNIITERYPSNIILFAVAYDQRSTILLHSGKLDEAIKYRLKVIEIYMKVFIPEHAILAEQYTKLARIYCYKGNYQEALSTLFKARNILKKDAKKLVPEKYFQWHSALHEKLGEIYYAMANYDKAILNYEIAAENLMKYIPENDIPLLEVYRNMGEIYRDKSDYEKALYYQERALEIANRTLPRSHPTRAKYFLALATTNESKGDLDQSLRYAEQAMELLDETGHINHPIIAWIYSTISNVYKKKKKVQQALEYELKALFIRQISLSPNHKDIICSYVSLGKLYLDNNDDKEALKNFEKAADIFTESGTAKNYQHIQTFLHMANIHFKHNNYTEAIQNYENALAYMFEPNVELEVELWSNIAAVYAKKGNSYKAALAHFTIALDKLQKYLSENQLKIGEMHFKIGTLHQTYNELQLALKSYEIALELVSNISPPRIGIILQIEDAIEQVTNLGANNYSNNNDKK